MECLLSSPNNLAVQQTCIEHVLVGWWLACTGDWAGMPAVQELTVCRESKELISHFSREEEEFRGVGELI